MRQTVTSGKDGADSHGVVKGVVNAVGRVLGRNRQRDLTAAMIARSRRKCREILEVKTIGELKSLCASHGIAKMELGEDCGYPGYVIIELTCGWREGSKIIPPSTQREYESFTFTDTNDVCWRMPLSFISEL